MPELQPASASDETIRIVLVNNMADAALAITERRFHRLLQSACPQANIDFRCVTLPAIPRDEMAQARIARHYLTLPELHAAPPEALIFSGAEPVQPSLKNEIFWPGLTELFDWAKQQNIPSLFSCLAAHAATLHFAGIERRRLAQKCFGIFAHTTTTQHKMLAGLPTHYTTAHSRWNDLQAEDLRRGGYDILTQSATAGVDMFVPRDNTPHVFLQGHPEYEETALQGEYNRDLRRYDSGQHTYKPNSPQQEDWGSSACPPKPPGTSLSKFDTVIRNWMLRHREMVA